MFSINNYQFVIALGLACCAPRTYGSDIPTLGVNLCTLHYTQVAYGKPVKSVVAHTGIYRDPTIFENNLPFWDDVKDVPLSRVIGGDHFAGKVVLLDRGSTYQPCRTDPIVQFWVTFEDGTTRTETPSLMLVAKTHFLTGDDSSSVLADAEKTVHEVDSASFASIDTVSCVEISSYGKTSLEFVESYSPSLIASAAQNL